MERKSIVLETEKQHSLDQLVKDLETILDATLVSRSDQVIGTSTVALVVLEEFYFRVSSYVSLTVLIIEDENKQRVELIGSGGGNGMFGIDLGANQDFAQRARNILVKRGFVELLD